MKKNIFKAILFLFAISLLVGCEQRINNPEMDAFLSETAYGVYNDGVPLFVFDETLHQTATDDTKSYYRIQTDDQTQYIQMTITPRPATADNQTVTLKVESRGLEGVSDGDYTVKILQKNGAYWLWDENTKRGFIIP